MQITAENLPNDIDFLKRKILEDASIKLLNLQRIEFLEELIRFYERRTFVSSSEQIHSGQGTLFNEAEATPDVPVPVEKQTISYERSRPKRKPIPAHLPRKVITYEIPENERQCSCGGCLKEIGAIFSEQMDIIPAKVCVLKHVRKKYACSSCQEGVRIATMPAQPIPKSNASPGILAFVAINKYGDGLPLHRVENIFARLGLDIPRSTLASWMIKLGGVLTPLFNLMREQMLAGKTLHIDETTIQVLKEKNRKPTTKSYMWVAVSGDVQRRVVCFNYDSSRSADIAEQMTEDFTGYLMTDGYAGYARVGKKAGIIHCGCWDHVRRAFHDVIKARPKDSKPGLADEALYWINLLYDVESRAKGQSAHRRWILRNLYSRGIIKHLEKWKDFHLRDIRPKSLTGKAINYLHNQWPKLLHFLEDGEVPFSNAAAENAIRPFVIGRKAWLFSDTPAGADASATIYSVIETAKANDIEPYEYLRLVIEKLPQVKTLEDVESLLPWNVKEIIHDDMFLGYRN